MKQKCHYPNRDVLNPSLLLLLQFIVILLNSKGTSDGTLLEKYSFIGLLELCTVVERYIKEKILGHTLTLTHLMCKNSNPIALGINLC